MLYVHHERLREINIQDDIYRDFEKVIPTKSGYYIGENLGKISNPSRIMLTLPNPQDIII